MTHTFYIPCSSAVGKGHLKDGNGDDSKTQHSNSSESLQYNFETIKSATGNFSIDNKLGEGGFGSVYKVIYPTCLVSYNLKVQLYDLVLVSNRVNSGLIPKYILHVHWKPPQSTQF